MVPGGVRQNSAMSDPPAEDAIGSTDPHDAQAPARVPPPRRRRRRRVAIGIVLLTVVAAAVYWRATVTSDPKLQFTKFNRLNREGETFSGFPAGVNQTQGVDGPQLEIPFVAAQRVFLYLGLRNGGGQTVRIEKVPAAGFYYFGFDGVELAPKGDIGEAIPYEPFKPFSLGAGEERKVRLTFRLADCPPVSSAEPGFTSIHGLLVEYTIFGFRRGWAVPFEEALAVRTNGPCDHPITDPSTPNP